MGGDEALNSKLCAAGEKAFTTESLAALRRQSKELSDLVGSSHPVSDEFRRRIRHFKKQSLLMETSKEEMLKVLSQFCIEVKPICSTKEVRAVYIEASKFDQMHENELLSECRRMGIPCEAPRDVLVGHVVAACCKIATVAAPPVTRQLLRRPAPPSSATPAVPCAEPTPFGPEHEPSSSGVSLVSEEQSPELPAGDEKPSPERETCGEPVAAVPDAFTLSSLIVEPEEKLVELCTLRGLSCSGLPKATLALLLKLDFWREQVQRMEAGGGTSL